MVLGIILLTFIGAIFGALFGYILGQLAWLFLGVGGAGLPAMLAALGFLGGAVLGILSGIGGIVIRYGAYTNSLPRWARKLGMKDWGYRHRHWPRHHGACASWGYRWYDGFAGEFGAEPYSVEDSLQEIDGYISYLEDLPADRVAAFKDKIGRISDRLNKLGASLHQ